MNGDCCWRYINNLNYIFNKLGLYLIMARQSLFLQVLETPSLLTAFILFLAFLYWWLQYRRKNTLYAYLNKILPGPRALPYFGNSLELLRSKDVGSGILLQYIEKYGSKPFRLWIGSELFVVLSDADDIEIASKVALGKPEIFRAFRTLFKNSFFTILKGNKLRTHRKKFATFFKDDALLNYLPVFRDRTRPVLEILNAYAKTGKIMNAWDVTPIISFETITRTMMNAEVNHSETGSMKFHDLFKRTINMTCSRFLSPLAHNTYMDRLLYGNIKQFKHDLIGFIKSIVDVKIEEDKKIYEQENGTISMSNKDDTSIWKTAYNLSLEENDPSLVYHELFLFVGAGVDSTAISIAYILLMLAIHSDIQDKVYNEHYEVFGDSDREITSDDLKQLVYLDQVIREALRLLSLVPYVFRCTEREVKIRDIVLPVGTNIMLFLLGTHYNSKYYPEPSKFNPDNFSAESLSSRPKCSNLSFVTGPKDCIGKKFAMMEIKVAISMMLGRFKFSTNLKMEDIKYSRNFLTTVADNHYPLFVKERN